MGDAVAVTDEDVLTVQVISCAVACCLIFLLVAFEEDVTATVAHVNTLAVEVGAFDAAAATHRHTVVALGTLTAVVPGYEEVVPAVVLKDERCLDGVRTGEVGGGILRRIGIHGEGFLAVGSGEVEATGDGCLLLWHSNMQG